MIYLVGSLRNPGVPALAKELRAGGFEVWDDWFSAGERADEEWQAYEQARGRSYVEALAGDHARHVFDFDRDHIEAADTVILVLPAGRSAHLELGWAAGRGKQTFVLFDGEPERFDCMYLFADAVFTDRQALKEVLVQERSVTR